MMKKTVVALAIASTSLLANIALAQQQAPWLIRARVLNMIPANKSDPIGGVGDADRISVAKKTFPELDVSYFFTPNIAAELVVTYPQKHDVMLDGTTIGSFKHLPPTLMGQYRFMPEARFDPYLGAGVNYTRISSVDLLGGAGGMDRSSVGLALQAGIDFNIDKIWSINLDVKKVQIRSDVTVSGTKVSNARVDPLLVSLGVGYRF